MTDRAVTMAGERLGEALVGLLSHDLRSPLGPLALATSSIAEDPSAPDGLRELARFAEAQSARIARLIDAVLWYSRSAPAPQEHHELAAVVTAASDGHRALGGTCSVEAHAGVVRAHPTSLRDALTGLIECVAGEGGEASVRTEPDGNQVHIVMTGRESAACSAALAADAPRDWRSAFALGAAAVLGAHGGGVRIREGDVVATLPAGAT